MFYGDVPTLEKMCVNREDVFQILNKYIVVFFDFNFLFLDYQIINFLQSYRVKFAGFYGVIFVIVGVVLQK